MGSPQILSSWQAGVVTYSGDATNEAAESFAQLLPVDTVLTLEGDLGAGKTTFVRGLARGWGIADDVTSPSFALLHVYQGIRQLIHIDAYRLNSAAGFDDLLVWDIAHSPWNVVIEWPEKVASRLPKKHWKIKATILADGGHQFKLFVE
jgi:tRNA threonylcarbamoyladenosine biosynthesis protein TsaE